MPKNYELYYEQLSVEQGADEETIKKAYKKLALKFHPDKNQGDAAATQKFLEIGMAYEKLIKMLHGEESGDEDDVWEPDEKEAELEMLRRELERERRKERRRKEQERWEEEFKLQQRKKKMAREREEREEEFRLKEEQIKRERQQREQAMRKRNDRLSFIRRANTSSGLYTSPTNYSSFTSYKDTFSPNASYSYSANLANKWSEGGTPETNKNGTGEEGKENVKVEDTVPSFATFKPEFRNPAPSYDDEEFYYQYKKTFGDIGSRSKLKENINSETDFKRSFSANERVSTSHFPNKPRDSSPPGESGERESTYVPFMGYRRSNTTGNLDPPSRDSPSPASFKSAESAKSPPTSSYSYSSQTSNYGSRRSSEFGQDKSSNPSPTSSTNSRPFDFTPFSNYLSSNPDLTRFGSRGTSRDTSRGNSRGPSPNVTSPRPEVFTPPRYTTAFSNDDLLFEESYSKRQNDDDDDLDDDDDYLSKESWFNTHPKKKSNRVEEQLQWEKQFHKERQRRMRAREEEEAREEARIKLELKNQQILQNQRKMEKKRWEEKIVNSVTRPDDQHSTGYVEFKQYHFKKAPEKVPETTNGTTNHYPYKYNSDYRSPSPSKQYRSVHVQTADTAFRRLSRSTSDGGIFSAKRWNK